MLSSPRSNDFRRERKKVKNKDWRNHKRYCQHPQQEDQRPALQNSDFSSEQRDAPRVCVSSCAILWHRPQCLGSPHNPRLPGQQTTADLVASTNRRSTPTGASTLVETGSSFAPALRPSTWRQWEPEVILPRSSERLSVDRTGAVERGRSCGRGEGSGGGGWGPVPEDGGGGGELGSPGEAPVT